MCCPGTCPAWKKKSPLSKSPETITQRKRQTNPSNKPRELLFMEIKASLPPEELRSAALLQQLIREVGDICPRRPDPTGDEWV